MQEDFIEHEGAMFKCKADGGYHRIVFCPSCGDAMPFLADMLCFYCPKCNWRSNFTGQQLQAVMNTLPETPGDN